MQKKRLGIWFLGSNTFSTFEYNNILDFVNQNLKLHDYVRVFYSLSMVVCTIAERQPENNFLRETDKMTSW